MISCRVSNGEDNMLKEVQTISNRGSFGEIFNKFFIGRKVFLKLRDKSIEVSFLQFDKGLATVKVPFGVTLPVNCQILTRVKRNIICVNASLVRQASDILYFNPSNIQIITSPRQDTREILSSERNRIAFATNIISRHIIENDLNNRRVQMDKIREMIKFDGKKPFELMKIHFTGQEPNDSRMEFFLKNRKPLYIADFNNTKNTTEEKLLEYYMKNIYEHDSFLKAHKQYVAELSMPIMFKAKIPYGYVQTNHTSPFSSGVIPVVRRIVNHIEDLGMEYNIFSIAQQPLPLSDISQNGIGIVFRDRNHLSYYKENVNVALDILLPRNKKASMLADVRHIDIFENRVIKVGFEIKDMDEFSQDNYNRFLKAVSFE